MTNEDLITDLKQFISAELSQQLAQRTADLATKDDIKQTNDSLRQTNAKVDEALELLRGVSDVVEDLHRGQDRLIKQGDEHEIRLERLEHKPA
jgi:hypothetical protein